MIEGERRRCNTMLSLKQNEVETLREEVVQKTKAAKEYEVRCSMMAIWSCQGKMIGRVRSLQMKCFYALQRYREWKKHSKIVLAARKEHNRRLWTRRVF